MAEEKVSGRSRLYALLFCIFLGWAGAHRYYVNKIGTGILMLITGGGMGLWWLIDLIMISVGGFNDKEDLKVINWK